MNDKQLRSFIAVAESLSFAKAAERVFVSVPALKKQIDMLENETNAALVLRSNKGIQLTDAGKYFYERCLVIIHEIDKAVDKVKYFQDQENNTVRLWVGKTIFLGEDPVYFDALYAFKKQYPQIKVELYTTADCPDVKLYDVIVRPYHYPGLTNGMVPHLLCEISVFCVLRKNHPLLAKDEIALSELLPYEIYIPKFELFANIQPTLCSLLQAGDYSIRELANRPNARNYAELLQSDMILLKCGFSDTLAEGYLTQVKLSGHTLKYFIYTKPINKNPIVDTYVGFISNYYREQYKD